MARSGTPITLLLVALLGCTERDEVDRRWSVSDSGGITAYTYTGEADSLEGNWTETRSVSSGHWELARISDASVGPDGTVAMLDATSRRVVLMSPDGDSRAFGRGGEGPGEFTAPVSVSQSPGEVHVFDRRRQRLVTFDSDGVYVRETPSPTLPLYGVRLGSGGVLAIRLQMGRSREATTTNATRIESVVALDVAPENGVYAALLERPGPPEVLMGSTSLPLPISAHPIVESRPGGGAVFASGGDPEVILVNDSGRHEGVFRWPDSRQPVGAEQWDSLYQAALASSRPGSSGLIDAMFDDVFRPPHLPWAEQVVAGSSDVVWVQAFAPGQSPSRRVYRIDLSRESVRRGLLPEPARLLAARGDTLVVRTSDDLGVQSLRWWTFE